MFELRSPEESPFAPQMFGNAGRDHMQKYGSEPDHYAWIGWKNHKHSVNNPYAQFQDEYTIDEIKDARMIHEPLTKLQCSPTSDGAACAIVASESYVDEHGLWDQAVEIAGQAMVTDLSSTFDDDTDCIRIVGYDMSKEAARQAYEEAEVSADEVDVVELHDCFSANELITYEALGLAEEGEGHKLVDAEATTYGGSGPVVNPSGGLISKGHPLGATGLAQCSELTWQLRGKADKRQVDGAKVALQHNIGLGGAAVVSVYKPQRQRRCQVRQGRAITMTTHRTPAHRPHRRAARLPGGDPRLRASARPARPEQRERLTQGYTELHNQEIYEKLAELGWLGVSIDEEYGGSGGGMVDRASSSRRRCAAWSRSRATASA